MNLRDQINANAQIYMKNPKGEKQQRKREGSTIIQRRERVSL